MLTEKEYLAQWIGVYVPRDLSICLNAQELAREPYPVEYVCRLMHGASRDTRLAVLRPTRWGAWLRGISTVSHQALQLTLEAAGNEIITTEYSLLGAINFWPISWLNAVVSRIPVLRKLCHYELFIARPKNLKNDAGVEQPSVSIIMPCKNEAGTVEEAIRRLPLLGVFTEIICVEGHSQDATLQELLRVRDLISHARIEVMEQSGKGKKNAVVEGCARARGDILMVFDSDMTVTPEDMKTFYDLLVAGNADLINGSRLLFTLEKGAMRWPNFIANHLFAWVISYSGILGQKISDTLCGTKVCWRRDYERSRVEHAWLWSLDPFGDFSWLFGIAMLGGKIQDLPVRYYARTYGRPLQGSFRYGLKLAAILWNIGLVRIIRNNVGLLDNSRQTKQLKLP